MKGTYRADGPIQCLRGKTALVRSVTCQGNEMTEFVVQFDDMSGELPSEYVYGWTAIPAHDFTLNDTTLYPEGWR